MVQNDNNMQLPDKMRVIEITQHGGPENLALAWRDLPKPQTGEVLIQVEKAGVNRPDCLQRQGNYAPPPDASDILGLEVAGKIVAIGQGVDSHWLGQNVTALTAGGGYATFCVAPLCHCLPFPKGYDSLMAAALPENFFTVWHNVYERGALSQEEVFLVHGGSSGIGSVAIQLAKATGAYVITTVGSDEKAQFCYDIGADFVINYKKEAFDKAIIDKLGMNKINLILDMVGGDYIDKHYKLAAMEGRIVQIAFLQNPIASPNFARLMTKRLMHTGSTLRPQSIKDKARIAKALQDNIWSLLDSGSVKPYIDSVFPLEDAVEAHRYMESSQHMGKIMLDCMA